ncbi:aspartyl-phosphate phosphatase Spo0E family protein [Paenibacillus sp. NEAU-GSW1]|uniref:aspartyl-phosphate phosphatase Spo0E family protein n=1 Tax=Paenibacillus sp. NEAU-GSW1 TaxID=2682486 RepID=UPI0012E0CCA0|nr:aspartyl-phosphate phosphatase Spo0E family protein [Paenibacillus sp. NEAU-GSW1]MUT65548.1 Spo0E family sporulation regulatory protein-aspartic acid phosphatase [Paenibacillus sp. NEAU-GSW1]
MEKQLLIEMEKLREEMVEIAMLKQNFLNIEVLQLSQSLDKLIIQAQEERRELVKSR